ncbi:DsbA family protein [Pseudomonas oryzihabitans]|uniref:Protein-disulfide isomerase n=1 Tax=Pseudomonas oryzihabitans TaxID=47885 RepID=A0A2Z5ADF6_9PSED|nr:thioredoxin domain-containing protein [Pseudomonas oryzihabitans]AXA68604.1 protein-disulfide isomerase [Pseudomonas oryzihabitans]
MKKPPILATPWGLYGILMAMLVCALIALAVQGRSTPASAGAQVSVNPEPPTFIYGDTNARFTLVEYGDLECPYCKDAYPQVKQLIDRHEALNWQWHHLPLPMHGAAAQYEARLVTCAGWFGGNPVFWQAVEAVYQHSRGNGSGLAMPIDQLGLQPAVSPQHLEACTQDNTTVRRVVAEQTATAAQKGIDATPTFELRDNRSGRTIRLPALLDDAGMLSAMDWLASQGGANAQQRR